MYVGRGYFPVQDNSAQVFGYDLSATLPPWETISAAKSGLLLISGMADISPNDHLIGATQISGPQATQLIWWNDPLGTLVGNIYAMFSEVTTSLGELIIPWSRIVIGQNYGPSGFAGGVPSSSSEVFILPAPGPTYILPTDGGYARRDFPEADQGEQRFFGFDFAPMLSPDEVISGAQASLWVLAGKDPTVALNTQARFVGSPVISGSQVKQMVNIPPSPLFVSAAPEYPDLRGVVYALSIAVATSFSQAIGTWSRLRVRAFYG